MTRKRFTSGNILFSLLVFSVSVSCGMAPPVSEVSVSKPGSVLEDLDHGEQTVEKFGRISGADEWFLNEGFLPPGPASEDQMGGDVDTGQEPLGPGQSPAELLDDRVGALGWERYSRWEFTTEVVLDLCDDTDMYFFLRGHHMGPGDEFTEQDSADMSRERAELFLSCGDPSQLYYDCEDSASRGALRSKILSFGTEITREERSVLSAYIVENDISCFEIGTRYVYLTAIGPGPPADSPVEARKRAAPLIERSAQERYALLGSLHAYTGFVENLNDEIALVVDSIKVTDGVVRGLVHNQSTTQFARNLIVSIGDSQWTFPLTVQPGELAPFEILGWDAVDEPTADDFNIQANFSSHLDISRSFRLDFSLGFWSGDSTEFSQSFPGVTVAQAFVGKEPFYIANPDLFPPDTHPSISDLVLNQTISDLRAFAAIGEGGQDHIHDAIVDLIELDVYLVDGTNGEFSTTSSFNAAPNSVPAIMLFVPLPDEIDLHPQIWIGGANSSVTQPPGATE